MKISELIEWLEDNNGDCDKNEDLEVYLMNPIRKLEYKNLNIIDEAEDEAEDGTPELWIG